jgi:3D (Asp-Asp-Asp) domain-containing protein
VKLSIIVVLSLVLASDCYGEKFRVTNYDGPTTKTASGHRARYGICAADWKHHPPGTIIKLDTGERLVVADVGPAVKGRHHIDRFNPSHKIFPTVSRGYVVSRGGPHRNRKEIYQSVLKGLEKKKQLDKEAKKRYYEQLREKSCDSRRGNSRITSCPRNERKDKPKPNNSISSKDNARKAGSTLSTRNTRNKKPN